MENNMRSEKLFLILFLFIQSCKSEPNASYVPDWEAPTISHTLQFPQSGTVGEVVWEKQAYVLSSAYKRVQCVATDDIIVIVGSQGVNDQPEIFALDGKTGDLLWSVDNVGVLAKSDDGLFIGDGTKVSLIDPRTGLAKWQEQLLGIRNITGMMFYDGLLFVNGTGVYTYYVMATNGKVVSKYIQPTDFFTNYKNVPFYPDLPYGYIMSNDIFIQQRGDILYSGYVYESLTNKLLWQVEEASISNFVVLKDYIYWVSSDDYIKIADKYSGDLIDTIKIVPSIAFFDPDSVKQNSGYYLCADSQSNSLYVILGDSRQIFALNLMK